MGTSEMSELIIAVLSSSVMGAIVAALFNNRRNKYDKAIENITSQRTGWREKIKGIAEQIQNEEYSVWNRKSLDSLLCQLEMNINSYGYLNRHITDKDGHIWSEIEALRLADNVNEYNKRKRILLLELDFLLKEDWERSKKEVKGKLFNTRNVLIVLFFIVLHGIFYFGVCGQENIPLLIFEGLMIGVYSFLIPSELIARDFNKVRYRREKNVKQLLRMRIKNTFWKVGDIFFCAVLIIVIYALVYTLMLAELSENITYNVQNEVVISEQNANGYLEKIIYEKYEKEKLDIVLTENVEENNSELSALYLKVATRELIATFWINVFLALLITFIYTVCLIIKELGDTQYKDSIRRVQLIEKNFYVHEIDELIQNIEQLGKRKNSAVEYEMTLRILYIKLDELAKYLKESKYSRMQTIESYSDIERELRFEAVCKDVSDFLKLFGRKGSKLVQKRGANKEDKKELVSLLKKLNLKRLL